jgi:hypothetical protein
MKKIAARFEIAADGKPRSYRSEKKIAVEGAARSCPKRP